MAKAERFRSQAATKPAQPLAISQAPISASPVQLVA
jgi:hypothetical protein